MTKPIFPAVEIETVAAVPIVVRSATPTSEAECVPKGMYRSWLLTAVPPGVERVILPEAVGTGTVTAREVDVAELTG
jgi:hypothetical protein